jgi:cysteine desulfurase
VNVGEVFEYVKEYARQETVGPLKGAGRWLGYGAAGAVLLAMGYSPEEAASGLRLSLGPWLSPADLAGLPAALEEACRSVSSAPG